MWGKVAMCHSSAEREAPPRRRPRMSVRRCTYGKRESELRTRSASFATLPFGRWPKRYQLNGGSKRRGRLRARGGYDSASIGSLNAGG